MMEDFDTIDQILIFVFVLFNCLKSVSTFYLLSVGL